MSRRNVVYMPDSGVEPGRDGRRNARYYDGSPESYDRGREMRRDGYGRRGEGRTIGFDRDPYARGYSGTRMNAERSYGSYYRGYGGYDEGGGLNWEDAKEWMMHIRNGDGKTGPHWSIDQTNRALEKKQLDCEPHEFWATMNMLYSDYGDVAKKYGVDNAEFFACMAEAFLDDEDAVPDKLAVYYDCIVEH